jgi:nucleoside-diphosphate-sugar epimerase
MNIFVFGGNRFVGKALTEKLLEDHKVTVFNRQGTGPEGVQIIEGDRNDFSTMSHINFNSYDLILDFCLFNGEQFDKFADLVPFDCNYIFISSASVGREQWGEYGTDKEECEKLVSGKFKNYKIIRPPYIDGENSHRARTAQIINQIENNQPVTIAGDGNYYINITWVDDVVNFIHKLITKSNFSPETIELSNPRNYLMKEYIETIAKFLGKDYTIAENSKPFWAPAYDLDMMYSMYTDDFDLIDSKLDKFIKWYNEIGKKKYGYN